MTTPLALTHFIAPCSPGNGWIDYLRDVLIDASPDDIADARTNNSGYPLDDFAGPSESDLLEWLNASVDALTADHRHVETIQVRGLTLDGKPAMVVTAESEFLSDLPSEKATAFAVLAWLVDLRQDRDRTGYQYCA